MKVCTIFFPAASRCLRLPACLQKVLNSASSTKRSLPARSASTEGFGNFADHGEASRQRKPDWIGCKRWRATPQMRVDHPSFSTQRFFDEDRQLACRRRTEHRHAEGCLASPVWSSRMTCTRMFMSL